MSLSGEDIVSNHSVLRGKNEVAKRTSQSKKNSDTEHDSESCFRPMGDVLQRGDLNRKFQGEILGLVHNAGGKENLIVAVGLVGAVGLNQQIRGVVRRLRVPSRHDTVEICEVIEESVGRPHAAVSGVGVSAVVEFPFQVHVEAVVIMDVRESATDDRIPRVAGKRIVAGGCFDGGNDDQTRGVDWAEVVIEETEFEAEGKVSETKVASVIVSHIGMRRRRRMDTAVDLAIRQRGIEREGGAICHAIG